jgi:hypothetical protein
VRGDAARARIEAAVTALQGGPDGCRRLAAWADDGYAHPDAHHVLRGVITPTGDDSDVADATRVNTSNWTFDPDADEGTVVDVVSTAGDATTIRRPEPAGPANRSLSSDSTQPDATRSGEWFLEPRSGPPIYSTALANADSSLRTPSTSV